MPLINNILPSRWSNTKILNLRVFGVFGKYEDYETRLISNIICRVIFKLPVEINQNAVYDFVYINDLVKIIEYFIEDDIFVIIINP